MTWKENLAETKRHYIDWWNHKGIVLNMWEHFQEGVRPHGPYAGEAPVASALSVASASAAGSPEGSAACSEGVGQDSEQIAARPEGVGQGAARRAASQGFGTGSIGLSGAPVPKDNDQRWFDPQWRAGYLDWYVGHSCLKADILPVANTQLGPGSLAAILGARFEGGDDTIWIHPDPAFSDDITFDDHHPNWLLHKALLQACVDRAQGHYYVGMPDLMEGLDVLAACKGTDRAMMDTVTQPEVVLRQMQQINDIYFEVFDQLYDIIRFDGRDCGGDMATDPTAVGSAGEMAFCYFSAWAPGKMTKLQCDVSTMLSTDDFRRFVLPFLRQQCQRIPYTIYHLDGVGAMRHLPALLEIDELKAIQWTPGVGQPQGGSPRWYDLYRQILRAGKSVLISWVQLDELRPLLDAIGTDGIHLEMDFHTEAEVDEAQRIVSEARQVRLRPHGARLAVGQPVAGQATPGAGNGQKLSAQGEHNDGMGHGKASPDAGGATEPAGCDYRPDPTLRRPPLEELMKERVLIFDGAMGTTIQRWHLTSTHGSNEYLCIERPDVIGEIYRAFLAAGSDIITANTFNAQRISLPAHLSDRVRDINHAAVRLARQMADSFTRCHPDRPRYVLGGCGPTRVTLSMEGAGVTFSEMVDIYQEQIEAQIEAGADGLLNETIFDTVNCEAFLHAALAAQQKLGTSLPVVLSFTVRTPDGFNMVGQDVIDFCRRLPAAYGVSVVGLNCNPDIPMLTALMRRLATETPYYTIVFPNAGIPDAEGHFPTTAQAFQREVWPLIDSHLVNIVGGCCGTDDTHMAALAALVQPAPGCWVGPHRPGTPPAGGGMAGGLASADGAATPATATAGHADGPVPTDPAASGTAEAAPLSALSAAIVAGQEAEAVEATRRALADDAAPQSLVNDDMIGAMSHIGQRFEQGKAFVPQLLMAGRAMKAAMAVIKAHTAETGAGTAVQTLGRIVVGTVKGDLHDIGKNLVISMLEGSGFEVIDLGIDVDKETFVRAVAEHKADILCMSALLTTTMTYMPEVIKALTEAGLRDRVKVMIGGAPITQAFADEIGADGYTPNANQTAAMAKALLGLA